MKHERMKVTPFTDNAGVVHRPTKAALAMRKVGTKLMHRFWDGRPSIYADVFIIDHRALERNKYAPWGRGHLSGLI